MGELFRTLDEAPLASFKAAGGDDLATAEAVEAFAPTISELLSLIADGVVSTDRRGRIILFNKAAEELFGYSRAEVLGRPVEILLPKRVQGAHREAFAAFARSPSAQARMMGHRREILGLRKNGQEFPAEASLSRRDVNGRSILTVVVRDVTARKQADEQRMILFGELGHRFKNMMTVVNSIVSLTARSATSRKTLVTSLRGRLNSLARTHDVLFRAGGACAELRELLEAELSPYRIDGSCNLHLVGEPCLLPARQVLDVALAVHELATNAAKYGALSRATGRVEIRWTADEKAVELNWTESRGPRVVPPTRNASAPNSSSVFSARGPASITGPGD